MTRAERRVRRRLLEEITFDRIRPHIVGTSGVRRKDVNYITSQVIHRVRKTLDYEGRQLGKRGNRTGKVR